MTRITVRTIIDAPPTTVWHAIEDVATHVEWMGDATAIRFTTDQRSGVGTSFECDTQVGPLHLTDAMEITAWRPRRTMGVRHVGLVTGEGAFTLRRVARTGPRRNQTLFTWSERLRFPWWMGGPVGGVIGGRILRAIWRSNLRALKDRIER